MNGYIREMSFSMFFSVNHSNDFDAINGEDSFDCVGLSLLSVVLLFIRTLTYFISCHLTARSLHNQMFNALLRAPVLFFDSNPIGTKNILIEYIKL